jgi:hypothetical protein
MQPGWSETNQPNPWLRITGTSEETAGFQRKYSIRPALFRQRRTTQDNRFPAARNPGDPLLFGYLAAEFAISASAGSELFSTIGSGKYALITYCSSMRCVLKKEPLSAMVERMMRRHCP